MLITKITEGYVSQVFDTETKECIEQNFVVSGDVWWVATEQRQNIDNIMVEHAEDFYHPFDMEQPNVCKT